MPRNHAHLNAKTYSVAEHSYFLAQYIRMFWKDLELLQVKFLPKINHIEVGELVLLALDHDMPEIATGDIPHPFKVELKNALECEGECFDDLEQSFFKEFCNKNGAQDIWQMWATGNHAQFRHPILKIMDLYEYLVFNIQEMLLGKQVDIEHLLGIEGYMAQIFQEENFSIQKLPQSHFLRQALDYIHSLKRRQHERGK